MIEWWHDLVATSRPLVPVDQAGGRLRRRAVVARCALVLAAFDLNGRLIRRFAGDQPARRDTSGWAWIAELEGAAAAMREEIDAYRVGHRVPQVAEIAGLRPGSDDALLAAPVDRGHWRTLVLVANGRPIPEVVDHFPQTAKALAGGPAVTTAGFSVLEGGSHIAAHADPNSGALRVQVPITVPGRPGECRIAIEDDVVAWEVGRGVLFDVTAPHEVWNDTAEDRILLLVETPMPLPFPLGAINGLVQRLFRFHPSHQAMARRVRAFAEA